MNKNDKDFCENFRLVFDKLKDKRIVLYGTGYYTLLLLKHVVEFNFVALLDRDPEIIDREFFGRKVITVEEAKTLAEAIIIVTINKGVWTSIYLRISHLQKQNGILIYYLDGSPAIPEPLPDWRNNPYWAITKECAKIEIDRHDVIGFDVFDTLLMRRIYEPMDVFELMEIKLKNIGWTLNDFARRRKNAEQELSNEDGVKSPTLDNIYNRLGQIYKLTACQTESIKQIEIETEKSITVARDDTVELFRYALAQGKRVDLISDMYLPSEILENLLKLNGISGYNKLFVSCESGMRKSDSTFWDCYKKELKDKSILFFGDNEDSDCNRAKKSGINAMHLLSARDLLKASSIHAIASEIQFLTDSITAGLVISRIFNSPFSLSESNGKPCFYSHEDLAYCIYAPVVFTYIIWVMRQSQKDGVNKLLFVARDGYFLKKLYDYIVKKLGDSSMPKSAYLETSRSMSMFLSIERDEDIDKLIEILYYGRWQDFLLTRFGLDVYEDDKNADTYINTGTELDVVHEYIKPYRQHILVHCVQQRKRYKDYIKSSDADIEGLTALVEPSYHGTVQYYLSQLLNYEFFGYYCVAMIGGKNPYGQGSKMQSCFQQKDDMTAQYSQIYRYIIELEDGFLVSPTGSCLRIDANGNMLYDKNKMEPELFATKQKMFEGVIQYTDDMITLLGDARVKDITLNTSFVDKYYGFMLSNCKIADKIKQTFLSDQRFVTSRIYKIWD